MPRVVSIGPRFIGREDLVPMEDVKSRCMLSLIDRVTRSPPESRAPSSRAEILDACGVAIRTLVLDVYRSYDPRMVELKTLSDHELATKKIVVDHVKMSNQELMEFFREIALGIDHRVFDDCIYIRMVEDINNISKSFFIKRIWSMVWNSFTYRQEWLLRFLNRDYNFVATVVSLCTVVQTIYAIIAYQLPK
ncbi:hypothetical protein P8452_59992 [Trifolium repens]|nr:hypothetical protein P8452_59992 [Trifolium repens]